MTRYDTLRPHVRAEVQLLYDRACVVDPEDVPVLTGLARWISARDGPVDIFDVLRSALGGFGKDRPDFMAGTIALLGVEETRDKGLGVRREAAARLLGYRTGESLRKTRRKGRGRIDRLLDEVTSMLLILAHKYDFPGDQIDEADSVDQQPVNDARPLREMRRESSAAFPRVPEPIWFAPSSESDRGVAPRRHGKFKRKVLGMLMGEEPERDISDMLMGEGAFD